MWEGLLIGKTEKKTFKGRWRNWNWIINRFSNLRNRGSRDNWKARFRNSRHRISSYRWEWISSMKSIMNRKWWLRRKKRNRRRIMRRIRECIIIIWKTKGIFRTLKNRSMKSRVKRVRSFFSISRSPMNYRNWKQRMKHWWERRTNTKIKGRQINNLLGDNRKMANNWNKC